MARMRGVKINFFQDEDLAELSAFHRLLFQGLWLLADKAGRLEDRPKRSGWTEGFIVRYEVDGRRYIQILT